MGACAPWNRFDAGVRILELKGSLRNFSLPGIVQLIGTCLLLAVAAHLGAPSRAPAQEKKVSLSFTKELLYNMARDNEGEMTPEIIDRLRGLSPDVADVRILRSGGHITLEYTVMAADDLPVHFHLTLEKMALYRMAAAREDIDGMLRILRPAVEKEPLILGLAYRFNDHYSIVDLTIDFGPALQAWEEEEMKKAAAAFVPPPPPPKPREPARPGEEAKPAKEPVPEKNESRPPPPEKKLEPEPAQYLSAKKLDKTAAPLIDGAADEKAWGKAAPHSFTVRGASGTFTVTMSALWENDRVYFLVQWPDRDENAEHHPWVWSEEEKQYSVGKEVEDALALQFSRDGKLGDCMLSGESREADLWFWRAARTNPVGAAEDGTLIVSTERLAGASFYKAKNKRTVWVRDKRDAGTAPYKSQVVDAFEGEKVHRYVPREPSGSVADVEAKGRWKNGQWTVELARALDTGDEADLVFKSGREHHFTAAVFNKRERSEHSTSKELMLKLE